MNIPVLTFFAQTSVNSYKWNFGVKWHAQEMHVSSVIKKKMKSFEGFGVELPCLESALYQLPILTLALLLSLELRA